MQYSKKKRDSTYNFLSYSGISAVDSVDTFIIRKAFISYKIYQTTIWKQIFMKKDLEFSIWLFYPIMLFKACKNGKSIYKIKSNLPNLDFIIGSDHFK